MHGHSQALSVLNHAGVCLSYDMTWQYLRKIINEMDVEAKIKSGHWVWAYDNLNIHQRVRHERMGECINHVYILLSIIIIMHNRPSQQNGKYHKSACSTYSKLSSICC